MTSKSAIVLLIFATLSGCATSTRVSKPGSQGSVQAASEEAAIASALSVVETKAANYPISPADLLTITVFQNDDLKREVRVSQNGTISFPLIGTVKIGGLPVIEAEQSIAEKLKEYVVAPQVTVFIKEYGNKRVYVFGQVGKPGSYELPTESKLTVLGAVSMAGGFTPIAAPDRTRVIRNSQGKNETLTIEVSEITRNGHKEKDLPLKPNDVVYVPQSFF